MTEFVARQTHRSSQYSVLVIDDDTLARRSLVRLLTHEGYAVDDAANGETGLALLQERLPDVVLLDVKMPGIDGFEVCRRVKSNPRTNLTPVVLTTGLHETDDRVRGIDAGADDFLSKPYNAAELKARIRSLCRLKRYTDELDSAEAILISLALTIEARDPYTQGHCERLSRYATALGTRIGLNADDLAALYRGAYLHDLGKIAVPDSVLLKPGPLTADEWAIMRLHTVTGDRLCGTLRSLELVRPIVRGHHERRDGSGYPDGLRGDDIPLLAQIVAVVDNYDARTTNRPYRLAESAEQTCAGLAEEAARGWWRYDLVDHFLALCREGEIARLA